MNLTQYLLGKLAEEAAEVAQMALKCQQFGLHDQYKEELNSERLRAELNDLMAVIELLNEASDLAYKAPNNFAHKNKIIMEWAEYSCNIGLLNHTSIARLKAIIDTSKSGEEYER